MKKINSIERTAQIHGGQGGVEEFCGGWFAGLGVAGLLGMSLTPWGWAIVIGGSMVCLHSS